MSQDLGKVVTFEAGDDLSGSQFCFVTVASDGQVDPTGDGADADGVLQNNPAAAGRAATVMVGVGKTKIKAGGSFSRGAMLASDSTGRAVAATVTGDYFLGKALEAATGPNQYVSILFRRRGGCY